MKVLFINPILDCQPVASVGIASLSTHLKRGGHKTKLIIVNEGLKYPLNLERIYEDSQRFNPDLIAFSSVNSQYGAVIRIANYLKNRLRVPVIYGGPCPTVMPDQCIDNKSIDFVCIGEGEEALSELIDRYSRGKKYADVKNIWVKQNGKILRNPVRPLADLSNIYPLDFSIFQDMKRILEYRNGWFDYTLTRGCPFRCSHCQSAFVKNIYNNNYPIRYAPIDVTIENLENIINTYRNIKLFNFNDDTFNLNKRYISEFCNRYKSSIYKKYNIRFNVECRVDLFTEEVCAKLKGAGVRIVKFGVESGSYRVRRIVLNRDISDDSIIKAFRLCDKYGIETWAFNMLGLPTETRNEMQKTFKLNAIIKPDNFWLSIYYPIEKTKLYEFCVKNKLIKHDMLKKLRNYRTDSPLRSQHFKDGEISLIYKIASWIISLYAFAKHKDKFKRLINKAFKLEREHESNAKIEKFVDDNNKELDKGKILPYYSRRFKHIAIKIK